MQGISEFDSLTGTIKTITIMMRIHLNEIEKVIRWCQENSANSLKRILCKGNYEVKSHRVGNEYICIIEGDNESFNFKDFRVMTGIVAKCHDLADHDFNLIDPEKYFENVEQVHISKALLASITEGYTKADEELTNALWKWIFELGKQS